MKPQFNFSFDHISDPLAKAEAMTAYNKAMREMYLLISELTEFNPAKRLIDAVPLLERIGNTADLLAEELKKLSREIAASII